MRARAWVRVAQYGLTAIGVAALGYCAVTWVEARFYQAREARYFAHQLERENMPAAPHHVPRAVAAPEEGGLVGRLEIPRLGVSVMVAEGVESADLKRGVGHIPGTALPWQRGNTAIAGHRDTFFRPLRSIHRGDIITLGTLEGVYRYRVISTKVVGPEDVQVLDPTARDTLTLVTCFPFDYIGSAPERFIARAERAE